MNSDNKFIVDLMLGKLARYLRILGYDTHYPRFETDSEILRKALREGRILITRDRELYEKAIENGIESVFVKDVSLIYSLNRLYCLRLIKLEIDFSRTRCPRCNYPLKKASNPPLKMHLKRKNMIYFICDNCGSIYWVGSHWKSIYQVLGEARSIGCD